MADLLNSEVDVEAEAFYSKSTISIEVLQGESLQKIRFWCQDQVPSFIYASVNIFNLHQLQLKLQLEPQQMLFYSV